MKISSQKWFDTMYFFGSRALRPVGQILLIEASCLARGVVFIHWAIMFDLWCKTITAKFSFYEVKLKATKKCFNTVRKAKKNTLSDLEGHNIFSRPRNSMNNFWGFKKKSLSYSRNQNTNATKANNVIILLKSEIKSQKSLYGTLSSLLTFSETHDLILFFTFSRSLHRRSIKVSISLAFYEQLFL